ncbi:MAG: DUF1926 domain-containing protein [Treponema sp.]|jgi:hypothetical protein|nr:DUF1926 domain-containing protein [Treponema sp.]
MVEKVSFILGSHNHLPPGIDFDEYERTYRKKLKPFISALYKFPRIQATLHYSGILLHWLERAHPEFFMLIEEMASRKQVEMLGGGFYEPMMPLIPLADKLGQIEFLTTYLRKQFGKRPQGCRLPALAWEQSLVVPLYNSGMLYTFLDEDQFLLAGLSGESPCVTEDQGKTIMVFPVARNLNSLFAQKRAGTVLADLLSQKIPDKEKVICAFPDVLFAEETESPDFTYQFFFEDLACFESSVDFTAPSKIYRNFKHPPKAYFPGSLSFDALSKDTSAPRYEPPRQFLIKYSEANGIYSKMLFTGLLINQLKGDKSRKRTAKEEIWKAQVYDAFCPSVSGGVYHHAVRKAAYKALLEAEKISREKENFTPSLLAFDFDLDGKEEFLFQEEHVNCYIRHQGASVFELDYLPKTFNYLDTFTVSPDGDRRTAFYDVLAPKETSFDILFAGPAVEMDIHKAKTGFLETHPDKHKFRFCGKENFEIQEVDKSHGRVVFRLPANTDLPFGNIEMEKTFHLKKSVLTVQYSLENKGADVEFFFIPSIDISFPGDGPAFLRIFKLNDETKDPVNLGEALVHVQGVKFQDIKNETVVVITADRFFDAYITSVRTPCPLGNGDALDVAVMYQSTNIAPIKPISLDTGKRFEIEFKLNMYH